MPPNHETHLFEVTTRNLEGLSDARGENVRSMLSADYDIDISTVRVILGYQVAADITVEEAETLVYDLFADPIIERGAANSRLLDEFTPPPETAIQVGYKPGVTDNPGQAGLDGLTTLFPHHSSAKVATYRTYAFWGIPDGVEPERLATTLHNSMIERASVAGPEECAGGNWPQLNFPKRPPAAFVEPAAIDLEVSDEELVAISERGLLALNLREMKAIQHHYRNPTIRQARQPIGLPPESPTDAELECLAQTWSEHCSHKIFAASIRHSDTETGENSLVDSLFKTHIVQPTLDIADEVDWLLSVFHDNSGTIAWNDEWSACIKAETHNSPSALDPYGGAITGIVGVNRDIIGTGLGARPIANTDVFCFGPPDYDGHLPDGLFHPSRVFRGVHSGVRSGGNESGIPTVNGAMIFDERYIGKPLVFCGTVGLMPRRLADGRESHVKTPEPGDVIYMVGGRVGSDGIHGATFSSLELTEKSPPSAVQIGDPITQKKMLDMILEARDAGLIQVITDNGAGGLSSSVGEMAELTGGADLELDVVPLKQAGLSPWEILVSESQERMTVGVRPEDCGAFEVLANLHEVEATAIGSFTDSGAFVVRFGKIPVAHLPIDFLHDGCPQLQLESEWTPPIHMPVKTPSGDAAEVGVVLARMMARPNVASKEWWVRSYDHEVIAQSVIKPFCGANHDAPSDAAVIAPIQGGTQGLVISNGIAPRYSDIDSYAMAAASVDEALRNAVCVGVDLNMIAGLDNFCWPDPVQSAKTPDGRYKLAQLVRANRAIDDVCRAYRLPCISGKDSMKNDVTMHGEKISVPPTLLFSLMGNHKDVRKAISSDFKRPGDIIYLIGQTHQELGASELAYMLLDEGGSGIGGSVPQIDAERNIAAYRALTGAMTRKLVASAHDCSDGGLSVALAECCFGADSGASIEIDSLWDNCEDLDKWGALFGESLGRILVSTTPDDCEAFETAMLGHTCHRLGEVVEDNSIMVSRNNQTVLSASIPILRDAWKGALDGGSQ